MELFLENFSGVSYILDDSWVSNSVLRFFTDSAGGMVSTDGKWACLNWPSEWEQVTGEYFEGYYTFRINTHCFISVFMGKSMAWKENIIPL